MAVNNNNNVNVVDDGDEGITRVLRSECECPVCLSVLVSTTLPVMLDCTPAPHTICTACAMRMFNRALAVADAPDVALLYKHHTPQKQSSTNTPTHHHNHQKTTITANHSNLHIIIIYHINNNNNNNTDLNKKIIAQQW